jgi:amino acid adenylation domain-containing protein
VISLLHHALDESAARDPSHEAFRCNGVALTYEQLAGHASQLARALVDAGIRPGDRVAIYMNKSIETPVALYGILKAGAAYVPIDPSAPLARIRFQVKDCGVRAVVTNHTRARRAIALAAEERDIVVVVGADANDAAASQVQAVPWDVVFAQPRLSLDVEVAARSLAYVMYTSGSTGVPKGLMHTHASGLSYARLSADTYAVSRNDRLGNHSPLHFDMSTFEYLTGPLCGSTTVIVPEETTMFPVSVGQLIEREALTFWYSVPLALIQLVTHGAIEQRDCRSLRWVLFGGEPFLPKYLWRLMELWPGARFSNVYGPAEVNQCTYYHVLDSDKGSEHPVPIGKLWSGAEGLIVNDRDEVVRPGEAGELLVSTDTMMQGYWGRPDLDERAFLDEDTPAGRRRFYRTGDLVRVGGDGNMVFLGRKDRQVKSRGYRVELDEIESVIGSLDDVAEAAVVALRDEAGTIAIAAAIQPRDESGLSGDVVRRQAASRLPPYALPQRIEIWDTLPRTATGKIDRRAVQDRLQSEQAR